MNGPATLANVISALASFFLPGLGQLLQGRWWTALCHFVLTGILWMIFLGWIMHFWSILDAALYIRRYTCCRYDDWGPRRRAYD